MHDLLDDPLGLDPLSPPPSRDPRSFIPAHAAGSFRTAKLGAPQRAPMPTPREGLSTWPLAPTGQTALPD
jgi:hypothetical protein